MRTLLLCLSFVLLVSPVHAQEQTIPDTLDWRLYYPLEVGNAWEWKTDILVAYTGFDLREIVADTILNGQRYFVQVAYRSGKDPLHGVDFSHIDSTFLRYDDLHTRVVALREGKEEDYTCNLSASFGSRATCDLYGEINVGGGYAEPGGHLLIGTDTLSHNAVKDFWNLGGGVSFFHGVGYLPGVGDGGAGSISFTYVRVGGKTYGARTVYVGVDNQPPVLSDQVQLYPNPVRDRLTVVFREAEGGASVMVYDVLGRAVLPPQSCHSSPCTVSASSLASGAYFIQVARKEGGSSLHRFAVAK